MTTLALVGRPNVGKSTLFNRLAGKRLAIVDDRPGVTRDWKTAGGSLAGLDFQIIDTPGLDDAGAGSLESRMGERTRQGIAQADVILFVIDARAGITPLDTHYANEVRRHAKPVILVANKAEGQAALPGVLEAWQLGLGEPVALSGQHGEGLDGLVTALLPHCQQEQPETPSPSPDDDGNPYLQIAFVGRPNAGKSTLMNALLGDNRVLTGPEAGLTRDAVAVEWQHNGQPIRLVDTAGMRKRARVEDVVEKASVGETLHAIRFAHVVVLMVDAVQGFDRQDAILASLVEREGRALVIALNKWDAVGAKASVLDELRHQISRDVATLQDVPIVPISAERKKGLKELLAACQNVFGLWNTRIPTAKLNQWLRDALDRHPPPIVEGRRLKLRYVTQIKTRPPTFLLFSTRPTEIPDSYLRYLRNDLRQACGLPAVPIRLNLRKGENPYDNKD